MALFLPSAQNRLTNDRRSECFYLIMHLLPCCLSSTALPSSETLWIEYTSEFLWHVSLPSKFTTSVTGCAFALGAHCFQEPTVSPPHIPNPPAPLPSPTPLRGPSSITILNLIYQTSSTMDTIWYLNLHPPRSFYHWPEHLEIDYIRLIFQNLNCIDDSL